MEEQLISFETAKLAKEKGFDEYGKHIGQDVWYFKEGKRCIYSFDEELEDYTEWAKTTKYLIPAPTQSLLQKWIRDKYAIEIEIYRTIKDEEGNSYGCQGKKWFKHTCTEIFNIYEKTYEQTLEAGLKIALEHIK